MIVYDIQNAVKALVTQDINLAKEAVKGREDVFIAGDIGPIPSDEVISREELEPFHPVLLAESCANLADQILNGQA
jgi:methionine synthase I (cobalamin-dependent)